MTTANLRNPFYALRHTNFRLYWIGMGISWIGTWMQNIAQPWLAYALTDSPLLLSLVGIVQFGPMLLFSLFAGVLIDRFPKKKIIFFTQASFFIITFTLALLVYFGRVNYWHILIAATAFGLANTLDMPTRQAFVVEIAGKEDLFNAIALNSAAFNLARVVGPALAGLLMSTLGIASCFYATALGSAAMVFILFFIKPHPVQTAQNGQKKILRDIRDGLSYVRGSVPLSKTILTVLIVATFSANFNVLVPVFSKLVLGQEEAGFGLLMSCMGVGSLLGAIFIAGSSGRGPKVSVLNRCPFLIALFLICTGFTGLYACTALALAATGFFFVSFASSANSFVQLHTDDEYRGRVMSIYTWVFSGSTPIGNLFAGLITDRFGPSAGFIACGLFILALTAFLLTLYKKYKRKCCCS